MCQHRCFYRRQMKLLWAFLGPRKTPKGPRKARREGGFEVKEYWTTPMSICCNFPSDDTNTNQQELHTREGAQITNRAAGPGKSFEFRAVMVSNVSSRLVRGSLIVRSFAEIIQHPPPVRLGSPNCAKLRGQIK